MMPYLSEEVQELLYIIGLALLGVSSLVAFGVALGMVS